MQVVVLLPTVPQTTFDKAKFAVSKKLYSVNCFTILHITCFTTHSSYKVEDFFLPAASTAEASAPDARWQKDSLY